jgi:hypothetical protein
VASLTSYPHFLICKQALTLEAKKGHADHWEAHAYHISQQVLLSQAPPVLDVVSIVRDHKRGRGRKEAALRLRRRPPLLHAGPGILRWKAGPLDLTRSISQQTWPKAWSGRDADQKLVILWNYSLLWLDISWTMPERILLSDWATSVTLLQ